MPKGSLFQYKPRLSGTHSCQLCLLELNRKEAFSHPVPFMGKAIPPHPLEYSLSLFIRVLRMSASCFSGISLLSLHIMAQHIVGRIAEHFPDVFFGNPVGQGDCRSERIAGHLGGQTLGNPT